MGLLSQGQSFLQDVMDAEGQSITYHRGNTALPFNATPDEPIEAADKTTGLVTKVGERDWAFALSELSTLTPAQPAKGDRIRITIENVIHEFAAAAGPNGAVFDWLDTRRGRISMHTVYNGTVTP